MTSVVTFGQEISHEHSVHHSFTENKGQWHERILFMTKFDGGNLWVQQQKMVFHLQDLSAMQDNHGNLSGKRKLKEPELKQTVVHLNFKGANDVSEIEKFEPTAAYQNYFIGKDPSKWASNVHGYGEAIMKDLYSGIDLKLIEDETNLKYEFHVFPGHDPSQIVLDYAGQSSLEINKKGDLIVNTSLGQIIEQKPYAYQIVNGNVREVSCAFELEGNEVKFKLGEFNPNATLVIDPVLVFATYCGSPSDNFGMTATYGYDGTAYSGGVVYGNAYPMPDPNAYDVNSNFTVTNGPTYGITDCFITKYSEDGTTMIWSTYLGGGDENNGTETAHSMICDQQNNVYLYGATSSIDFPIVNGYQSTHNGGVANANYFFNGVYFTNQGTDIFVAKISENGQNLMGSTFFGGSGNDGVNYLVSAGNYGNVAAYDSLTLNYGDQFRGEIMLDSIGNCLVASCTRSTDFPTQNAFQNTNAGQQDGVIFKLSSDLSALQWSSYYGGSENDACYSVKVDSSQNVIFAGGTSSNDLTTTAGVWQQAYGGGKCDGFVVKLANFGTVFQAASYIGMADYDQAYFVDIDRDNNIFVVGQSVGGNFPVINAGYVNPGSSQFVVKFDPDLIAPLNSTVFGNGSPDINISPSAFLVDICGNLYISGWGANILQSVGLSGMPTTPDAYQISSPNGFDFYLIVIEREMGGLLYGSYMGGPQSTEHVDGGTSRFDKNGVVYQCVCAGCGANSDFPTTPGAYSDLNLSSNCNALVFKFDFELIPNAEFTVNDNLGCAPFTVDFENFSTDSDAYLWDFGNGDTTSVIFEPSVTFDTAGVYQVFLYVTDSICLLTDTAEITITVTDSLELTTIPDQELCVPTDIDFTAFTNGSADTFIWSSNSNITDTLNVGGTSDSIWTYQPTSPGTYYIEASNDGCSLIDSVTVDYISSAITLSANDSICAGESTVITATNSNPLITFTYEWEPDSVIVSPSTSNQVTVAPNVSQYVYVTASSNTGCVVEDSIQIYVGYIPPGAVTATANPNIIPQGGTTTLTGQPAGLSYEWTPGEGVVNVNSQVTQATLDQPTIFTLTASDGICQRTDTTLVDVFSFVCENPFVYIPNAFSPNDDGENEVLYVRGAMVEEMIFRIYDRWGELVFESFDRNTGWDGTFRGKDMDPDTYDYYLKVTCIGGLEEIIKGNVTLMR
ncbi:MAG: hypothetical protein Crog4KO_14970 [Crocinitomicaceae bacterium]